MSGGLYSIDVWLVALVITVGILAGFGIFSRWCTFSPAVPRRKLEQLRIGMSAGEVTTALGTPRDVTYKSDGGSQWVYGAPMKRHILIVEFNSHSAVVGFAHGVPGGRRTATSAKD